MRGLDVRETQVAGPWREYEEETKTQLIWRRTQGRGYDLLGAKCRLGFENRERTVSTPLATPHNKEPVQIVRELFLLLRFSRRWRTHGYQTTNTDNERRTTDTETRQDNRIY